MTTENIRYNSEKASFMRGNTNLHIRIISISTSIIAFLLIVNLFTFSSEPEKPISKNEKDDTLTITAPEIPSSVTFAGEIIPIENNHVRESLDRELLVNNYWHSQTILFIKRANKYFPIIEPILKENNLPDDFKYLAVIESGLMIRAHSASNAVGLWQFLASTAKEYDLEVNSEVDERYNIEKSTVAACKFLLKSHEKFDSWTLAAASYNAGRRRISTELEKQKASSYFDLLLGEETGRYVYRILAVKEILSNPMKYGFNIHQDELYQEIATKEIEVDSAVSNFAEFAQNYSISYKTLKDLNPWLRDTNLTNSKRKKYTIKIPAESNFKLPEPIQEADSTALVQK